jgi:hypothetical protein
MGDVITLDILDRPQGGRRALRSLPRELPGLKHRITLATAQFVTTWRPGFTWRRTALLSVWEPDADPSVQRLPVAREHWHVRGEITRAAFSEPWKGWMPDPHGTEPLRDDEPALVLISGELKPRHFVAFTRDSFGAVEHAQGHPGYLGGLAIQSSLRNTTSCSAWRTYADARDYAYGQGAHALAMRRDRQAERHETQWFSRIRPLASAGTLDGRDPYAGLLEPALA